MTNREAYNQFIREKVEEQLAYMENMSNEELVDYTVKYPGYHIEVNLGDMLCLFKCNSGKMRNFAESNSFSMGNRMNRHAPF